MPIQVEEREIGGVRFRVRQLPYRKGRELLVRLFRVVGPALSRVAQDGSGDLQGLSMRALGEGLGELARSLTDAELEHAERVLAEHTEYSEDGESWPRLSNAGAADLLFAGRYELAARWLGFALEVNYRGFFTGPDGLGALVQRIPRPSGSPSPNTSSGRSTESQAAASTATG